jgi:hypothetical protein
LTAEHRARISESLRGRAKPPRSAEHSAHIAAAFTGRRLNPDSIAKRTATMKERNPLVERLLSRVTRTGSGCWEWQGSRTRWGYGRIGIDQTVYLTHRVSWEIHHGPIPSGSWILHHCDNPRCVNPEHLFLGDHTANMRDMAAKGRQWKQAQTIRT